MAKHVRFLKADAERDMVLDAPPLWPTDPGPLGHVPP